MRRPAKLFNWDFSRWSALVTVKVPLFDGLRTAGRVAQARAERNTVTQQIAALENQVRLDVQSAVSLSFSWNKNLLSWLLLERWR